MHSHAIRPACALELRTASEQFAINLHSFFNTFNACVTIPSLVSPSSPFAIHIFYIFTSFFKHTPSSHTDFCSRLLPNTAPARPNPFPHHQPSIPCDHFVTVSEHGACHTNPSSRGQPSMSRGAPDCLRVWRFPRQTHSHTISPPASLRS